MQATDSEAIVLSAMDYGESDRIVTLMGRECGKVRVIARHGKTSRKRFSGALEVFARLQVRLALKEGLSSLRGVDIMTVFPGIRRELAKIAQAGYACEVVDRLLPDALANPRLYRLLLSYLEHLDSSPAISDDLRFFQVNLLNILGYRPSLRSCSHCGTALEGDAFFSTSGELLCAACRGCGKGIGGETLAILGRALATGRFGVIRFPGASLVEAGVLLNTAIASHLNRPLRSLAFIDNVLDVQ